MCVWCFACMYALATLACLTGVAASCELLCRYWELSPGPLEEQLVVLITELSLPASFISDVFLFCFWDSPIINIAWTGLKLALRLDWLQTQSNLTATASWVLGLKSCIIYAWLTGFWNNQIREILQHDQGESGRVMRHMICKWRGEYRERKGTGRGRMERWGEAGWRRRVGRVKPWGGQGGCGAGWVSGYQSKLTTYAWICLKETCYFVC